MSGILIVSGRPRPSRLTATVRDPIPPPPRELPHLNPLIPMTLVVTTLGVVYFCGWIQVAGEAVQIASIKSGLAPPKAVEKAVVKRATFEPTTSEKRVPTGLLPRVKQLAYLVASEPTTQATFLDRLALLRSYFAVLTPGDRKALFGVVDFAEIEQAITTAEPKTAYPWLDRLFTQLQLTFH